MAVGDGRPCQQQQQNSSSKQPNSQNHVQERTLPIFIPCAKNNSSSSSSTLFAKYKQIHNRYMHN